jgi:hypothetical protein
MYVDALSFLEDERDAWAPFEALLELSDEALERPTDPGGSAHGWSGRDLMAHLSSWQATCLAAAKELAVGEASEAIDRAAEEWSAGGDLMNARLGSSWHDLPLDEVRQRFRDTPGELRGYLTVVPETRWIKHPAHLEFFLDSTIDHYPEHLPELEAILAAAG